VSAGTFPGGAPGPSRCPLCGNVAVTERSDEFRVVCGLCGGPRFPVAVPETSRAVPLLRKADAARKSRAKSRAATVGAGVAMGGVALISLLLLLFGFTLWAIVGGAIFGGPFVLLLLWALGNSSSKAKEIAPALDAAYLAAATELASERGKLTPADLQKAFGVDAEQADQLAAMVQVEAGLGGVRIATNDAAKPPGSLEAEFAEMEAAAEAEAAREAKQKAAPKP